VVRAIGIDLGGTSIRGGLIDEKGKILKKIESETGKGLEAKVVLSRIADIIKKLSSGEYIDGVCVGSPGFIDTKNGVVLSHGGNIANWAGTNIKKGLGNYFPNYKIFIENDANVAAICEKWIGAANGLDNFIMITLGTGLGGAIYIEDSGIWHGHNYQGAEFGHAILYPHGKECTCGQYGCAERYVSGTAIEDIYFEKTGIKKSGKDILNSYEKEKESMDTIDKFSQDLAIFIQTLKNIFDPEGIIIGGGVINSQKYWWNSMIKYYNEYTNNPLGVIIMPALHLNDAGIIGAGKIVFDRIK